MTDLGACRLWVGAIIFAGKYMHEQLTDAQILCDFCPKNIFPNFPKSPPIKNIVGK